MSSQKVYFYLENGQTGDIECGINTTVGEFLDKAEQEINSRYDDNEVKTSFFKDIHYVYLKGRKLEKECHLKDYINDLKNIPIFITKDPTKLIENSLSFININDYEEFKLYPHRSLSYNLYTAIDKRTRKKVLIYSFLYKDVISDFQNLYQNKFASTLDHYGILKVIGFCYPLNDEEKKKRKLFEYVDSKSQKKNVSFTGYIVAIEFDSILTEYSKMNPTNRTKIIYGVASIMKYVHQKGIFRNGFQIENVFIDENYEPKISGYIYDEYNTMHLRSIHSVPLYKAPETFMGSEIESCKFPADVYAFAGIIYKMFTNTINFDDNKKFRSATQFMMKICRGLRPVKQDEIPDPYCELIQRCWMQNPQDRPSFEEVVEELKSDKYCIEECGMKTNIDEIHEYQKRMDSY